jgi:iron complex transport system substrate-binding protein
MLRLRTLFLALLALAMVAAACADTDSADTVGDPAVVEGADEDAQSDESAPQATADFPVTIEGAGGTWVLESAPQRIVSLSPTATEMLFAIGAGDQVVAVDAFSNYPPEAPVTALSGFDPNIEAIVGFEPDLVVISNDANDLIAGLTELDVPVLVSSAPFDIEGGYAIIAELGVASGRIDETAVVIADLRAAIDASLAAAPEVSLRIYHELDETYFSASSFGFIGAVYAAMGATNIADDADAEGFGFPQLTEEYIVEADPELIVITDQVTYTPDDVAARPGWQDIAAVQNNNIVVVEADTASRWGPRLPQFISTVAEALAAATPVG